MPTTGQQRLFLMVAALLIPGAAIALLLRLGPIGQDPAYHDFADQAKIGGLDNIRNVATNLPFLLIGLAGLRSCWRLKLLASPYGLFFAGVLLTGPGSAYYHLAPDNFSLFLDRLPMAITFMAFFALVVYEYIDRSWGQRILPPLLLLGIGSVGYWLYTETAGSGDLRLYILVQYLPLLLIPLIAMAFSSKVLPRSALVVIFASYGLAKVCEALDGFLYLLLGFSGHSMKHLAAAFAAYWVWHSLVQRSRNGGSRAVPSGNIDSS